MSMFSMLRELLDMRGVVAAGEDAAVDLGVERLHAAVEDLGRTGVLRDLHGGHAVLVQELQRAARRKDAPAQRVQALREGQEAGLVGDADERAVPRGILRGGADAVSQRRSPFQ